ncbi:E3 ubiquitin-protein ligase TRIM15 isoform X1 [Dama dama]|uniref:E3 ubiquitin-protein ligase TRIM15 isoform X1 n=1 Tax=Dama dama TaxID=30532 RepID=UPI002A3642E3|nr:E3 ubiquitin-protein ligase TRIM15 isoform X1 [Dama dama]
MPSTPSHKGAACSKCKGPLEDAVTAACGHTFCRLCLPPPSQMGAQPSGRVLLCALCEEKEPSETLLVPMPLGPLGETYCEEHGEKIYFFCENDAEFLCVFCREGPSHQAHVVGFLDEAIQPYRDRLRSRLEALSTERDEIDDMKSREDQKLQVLLAQIESKKQQVEGAFERLQQELGEQQRLLLARLTELEQQIWKERDEYLSKLSEEVARLGAQVKELEEKCQQPASELLQDVRVNQSRCEMKTFVSPEAISPDLVKKIRDLHRKILTLPEMMRAFSDLSVLAFLRKSDASFGNRIRGRHSGPSDGQREPGPLRGQEVCEVHPAEAEPARQPPALRGSPDGAGVPRLLLGAPSLAGGGAAGGRRRMHGGGGRGGGEEEGGARPERRGGRLGGGPLPPAVLGQHLPGDRPAAERHPAPRGRRPGLRGGARGPAGRRHPGAHLHLYRLLLRQSLSLLRCLEKGFLPNLKRLKRAVRWAVRLPGIQRRHLDDLLGHGISESL